MLLTYRKITRIIQNIINNNSCADREKKHKIMNSASKCVKKPRHNVPYSHSKNMKFTLWSLGNFGIILSTMQLLIFVYKTWFRGGSGHPRQKVGKKMSREMKWVFANY